MARQTSFLLSAIIAASFAESPDRAYATMAEGVSRSDAATDYGLTKSPVAEGVIERYILDPRGEVEGLLLADGSYMYVTSRAEKELLRVLLPGDRVRVYGRRTPDAGLVQADVIKNLTKKTTFTVPLRLDLPMQEQRRLSVTEMYAKGTIRVLLYHPLRGIVQGMVLSEGTQIRLPPDTTAELRRSLRVGESVTIRGNGTTNQFGRAIEAGAIGKGTGPLVPLDASVQSLP